MISILHVPDLCDVLHFEGSVRRRGVVLLCYHRDSARSRGITFRSVMPEKFLLRSGSVVEAAEACS